MKKFFIPMLLISVAAFSQITQTELENSMQLLSGNDQQAAISNLTEMEKKYPETAEVMYLRSIYQFRDGDTNAAMMGFSNSIKKDNTFSLAYAGRAELFSLKGLNDKAIIDISKAITLDPENSDFVNTRAGLYSRSQQYALGLEDMKTIIRLKPNEIMGYYDAAIFSKKADPNYRSEVFFDQAYANKEIQKFVTDILYGKFLIQQKSFDEAKIKYESALAAAEKDFDTEDLHDAAIVFYKTKNYDKSIEYYGKVLQRDPKNTIYRNNLSEVYNIQQNWGKLKETALQNLAEDSNDILANKYYSIALENTGQQSLAREYDEKAHRLDAEKNK